MQSSSENRSRFGTALSIVTLGNISAQCCDVNQSQLVVTRAVTYFFNRSESRRKWLGFTCVRMVTFPADKLQPGTRCGWLIWARIGSIALCRMGWVNSTATVMINTTVYGLFQSWRILKNSLVKYLWLWIFTAYAQITCIRRHLTVETCQQRWRHYSPIPSPLILDIRHELSM